MVDDAGGSSASAEGDVEKFLAIYPDDPRSAELRRYRDNIDLDRLERKLQRESRGASDPALLPVEQLYVQADGMAPTSPEETMKKLKSLVDLYGVTPPGSAEEAAAGKKQSKAEREQVDRTAAIVRLAQRRIERLRAELTKQHERMLAELKERMATAKGFETTQPAEAAAMYRAMIELYGTEGWAEAAVGEARARLSKLNEAPTD
jgi:hypothetical protein